MIAKTLEFKRDEDDDDADEDDRLQQQRIQFDFKEDDRANSEGKLEEDDAEEISDVVVPNQLAPSSAKIRRSNVRSPLAPANVHGNKLGDPSIPQASSNMKSSGIPFVPQSQNAKEGNSNNIKGTGDNNKVHDNSQLKSLDGRIKSPDNNIPKSHDNNKGRDVGEKPKKRDAERPGTEKRVESEKRIATLAVEKRVAATDADAEGHPAEGYLAEGRSLDEKDLSRLKGDRKEYDRRERERKERERTETERLEKEKVEAKERKEKGEAEKRERQEIAAKEKLDKDRREKERIEAEKKERLDVEKREKERLEAEKRERELKEKKERERVETERKEKEKAEAEKKQREAREKKEREKVEAEKREKEKAETEKKEKERLEKEKKERERVEVEKKEKQRLETERIEREEKERKEKDRKEKERTESERREKDAREKEKRDKERDERERKDREHKEQETSFGVAGVPGRAEFSPDSLPDLISDDDVEERTKDGSSFDDDLSKTVNRIKTAGDYYEMLDLPRNASTERIQAQYKSIMQLLHASSDNGVFPSMPSVVKKIAQAYTFLSDPKKRSEYDTLLATAAPTLHSHDEEYIGHSGAYVEGQKTYIGGFFDSARMFMSMVVLAIIALLLFVKQAATSVARAVWPAAHKEEKWCSACRKYHTMATVASPYADSEGSFWEEGGRYYFLQGSTKHDVTSIVHDRYWRSQPGHGHAHGHSHGHGHGLPGDGCQFCGARSMDSHSPHFHDHDPTQTPIHEDPEKANAKAKKKTIANNNTPNNGNNRKATNKKKKH